MITMYGLAHCSTCQKAIAWLDEHGVKHRFVDYREHPVPAAKLKIYAEQTGWTKLVNRASYTWRGLSEAEKSPQSDNDWLAVIEANPTLLRRPLLLLADGSAVSGFSAKRYGELFA